MHRTDGTRLTDWTEWTANTEAEFNEPLLFCQWVSHVTSEYSNKAKHLQPNYMYARFQRIKRGKFTDADIVDWLIEGTRTNTRKQMYSTTYIEDQYPTSSATFHAKTGKPTAIANAKPCHRLRHGNQDKTSRDNTRSDCFSRIVTKGPRYYTRYPNIG